VFTKDGARISDSVKDRVWRKLCAEQKIENVRFHDLRHCAVTTMSEAGIAPEVIMKAVGHSDVKKKRLVPKAGFEPARVSPHAPQTCVSAIPPLRHWPELYKVTRQKV